MAIRSRLTGSGDSPLQAQNTVGNVASSLTATGSTQGTALLITEEVNIFSSVGSSTGAILRSDLGPGDEQEVANFSGGSTLTVYPPVGGTIQNGSANAGFSVANNKTARFRSIDGLKFTAVLSA